MNTLIEQTIQEFDEKFDTAIEQNDHIGQWIPELKAFLCKAMEKAMNTDKVTRFEVIDGTCAFCGFDPNLKVETTIYE